MEQELRRLQKLPLLQLLRSEPLHLPMVDHEVADAPPEPDEVVELVCPWREVDSEPSS